MRIFRHLVATRIGTRRRFDDEVNAAIEAAIREAEDRTSGEIRFVIETALDLPALWSGVSPRERALQVFAHLGVWDTELRNGVLIYVLLAERDVEIVADRGCAAVIGEPGWQAACRLMEEHFRAGRFAEGSVAGVRAVAALLEARFPVRTGHGDNRNELPDQPRLL